MVVPPRVMSEAASGLWRTVRYALESNARTARFCVILTALAFACWLIS